MPPYDHEDFQVVGEMGGFYVINGKAVPATEPMEARRFMQAGEAEARADLPAESTPVDPTGQPTAPAGRAPTVLLRRGSGL